MKKHQDSSYRIVMLRFKDRPQREVPMRQPIPHAIQVPVLMGMGYHDHGRGRPAFGVDVYRWNGHDLTVTGLPVYR